MRPRVRSRGHGTCLFGILLRLTLPRGRVISIACPLCVVLLARDDPRESLGGREAADVGIGKALVRLGDPSVEALIRASTDPRTGVILPWKVFSGLVDVSPGVSFLGLVFSIGILLREPCKCRNFDAGERGGSIFLSQEMISDLQRAGMAGRSDFELRPCMSIVGWTDLGVVSISVTVKGLSFVSPCG